MSKRLILIVVALFVAAAVVVAQPNKRTGGHSKKVTASKGLPGVVGTVQYEPGAPADLFRSGSSNEIYANLFNSGNGTALQAGTVSAASFYPGNVTGVYAVISAFGAPTGGGGAPGLAIYYVSGVAPFTFNNISMNLGVGPTFVLGQYAGLFDGPDSAGMRNATYNGQGFHGAQLNFLSAGLATGFTLLPEENAMIRASGDILIPVELMNFEVE
jgi:hypothetical protein